MPELKIIVVSGLPGVGKSTLSRDIAKELKIPIFSVDPIESSIIKSGINRSFETGLSAYLVAEALAQEQLSLGMSVIIDAVNPVKESRDLWKNLSEIFNAGLIIIECELSENIHKERVEKRIRNLHGISEVTWEDIENRRKEYLPWEEKHLIIGSSSSPLENLQKAINYISKNS